ncbi:Retrovirus-related Pol polyprotein from transposon RE1 [Vitis vinifera]|uniref:Retrovirus-related Pol polyprotein from transposon RE1 n=1 Tax=Vitis vinifera TaxID=29760 RepID=A0A438GEZ3_VITVI|nr:Retrovirus-related Pol polyprotein from transposon RE1 [Vitis vinifera]
MDPQSCQESDPNALPELDVKNAFLNGDLEEEVYMGLPSGFDKDRRIGSKVTTRHGPNHIMFYQHLDGKVTILIVYVDDIIITGNNEAETERLKNKLATEFEIKDLGLLRYFLGMEVVRNRSGITISQRKYVLDILKEIERVALPLTLVDINT